MAAGAALDLRGHGDELPKGCKRLDAQCIPKRLHPVIVGNDDPHAYSFAQNIVPTGSLITQRLSMSTALVSPSIEDIRPSSCSMLST